VKRSPPTFHLPVISQILDQFLIQTDGGVFAFTIKQALVTR
jgi:hypothetical protein